MRHLVALSQCWRDNIFVPPMECVLSRGAREKKRCRPVCHERAERSRCGQRHWASMQWHAYPRPHVTTRAHVRPCQKTFVRRENVSRLTSTVGYDTPRVKAIFFPAFPSSLARPGTLKSYRVSLRCPPERHSAQRFTGHDLYCALGSVTLRCFWLPHLLS
jgi:hypothetical protein